MTGLENSNSAEAQCIRHLPLSLRMSFALTTACKITVGLFVSGSSKLLRPSIEQKSVHGRCAYPRGTERECDR